MCGSICFIFSGELGRWVVSAFLAALVVAPAGQRGAHIDVNKSRVVVATDAAVFERIDLAGGLLKITGAHASYPNISGIAQHVLGSLGGYLFSSVIGEARIVNFAAVRAIDDDRLADKYAELFECIYQLLGASIDSAMGAG